MKPRKARTLYSFSRVAFKFAVSGCAWGSRNVPSKEAQAGETTTQANTGRQRCIPKQDLHQLLLRQLHGAARLLASARLLLFYRVSTLKKAVCIAAARQSRRCSDMLPFLHFTLENTCAQQLLAPCCMLQARCHCCAALPLAAYAVHCFSLYSNTQGYFTR
jgi:hypothetical protein